MAWHDESSHPFAGIAKKLERSDENISNLDVEIGKFFAGSRYPVLPKMNSESWQDALGYHRTLPVPVRFAVLCGEIVHHLRSSLDHIAWHFSSSEYRSSNENAIEFPVFAKRPLAKDETARYNRKVCGITNQRVLTLISELQPYNSGGDAKDNLVCIVHDMDRFDKHRELAVITTCANLTPVSPVGELAIDAMCKFRQGHNFSDTDLVIAQEAMQNHVEIAPQIAFAQFGNRKAHPVLPGLAQLRNSMFNIIEMFALEV